MKESLAHEELARTASAVSSLARISAEPTKSAQLHCVRCGFLPLLAHLLNGTSFLIVLFCYVVLCHHAAEHNCHEFTFVLFFPRELKEMDHFLATPCCVPASSQGGGSPT